MAIKICGNTILPDYTGSVTNRNTAIGIGVGLSNTTGTDNIAIGYQSLYTNGVGSNNISLGYQSLYSTTASNNIAIGCRAGCSLTTGSYNTIIGSYIGTHIATSSCNVVISDGAGNLKLVADTSGNVGIGTISPVYKLDIQTTATGTAAGDNTAGYFGSLASGRDVNIRFGDNVNASGRIGYLSGALYMYTNGSERLRLDLSGNLGIGTSSPTTKLDVLGSGDGEIRIRSGSDPSLIFSETATNKNWKLKPSAGDFYFQYSGTAYNSGYSALAVLTSSGNLGIGTSSPAQKLDVNGTAKANNYTTTGSYSATGGGLQFQGSGATTGNIYSQQANSTTRLLWGVENSVGATLFTGSSAYAGVLGVNSAYPLQFATNNSVKATLDSSGNLGIGRAPVAYGSFKVLDVAGANGAIQKWIHTGSTVELQAYASSTLTAVGSATNHPFLFVTNDIERARIDTFGNLGIGVTPSAWNSGYKAVQVNSRTALWASSAGDSYLSVNYLYDGADKYIANGFATAYHQQTGGSHAWKIAANNTSGAGAALSFTQAMTLDASGRLGLGIIPKTDWDTPYKAIQFGTTGALYAESGDAAVYLSSNSYIKTGGTFTYITTDFATQYNQENGVHKWLIAPSGTAGCTISFTQAMTLDASGRVLIGTTSASGNNLLQVNSDALINGVTVGKGNSSVSTNTAVGASALAANTTGIRNIAIGSSALILNQTGQQNIAIGDLALCSNVEGGRNIAIGASALAATTGSFNTGVGASALAANTSGEYNAGFGRSALASNTTGQYNTALGALALQASTIASNNTAVGYSALYSTTTGINNVALGSNALYTNTIGESNTGIGYYALQANTTGVRNTAVGRGAGQSITTGSYNVAIGYTALPSTTSADDNVALGTNALFTNTSYAGSVAIGRNALYYANGGSEQVAVGRYAAESTTTGDFNTAIGGRSLRNNTIGSYNTALGYQALHANTTASNNTAVGYQALFSNTIGDVSVAIGANALRLSTTGLRNTAVGAYALATSVIATDNTGLGFGALSASLGGFNTAVGSYALNSNTAGSSNTSLGYQSMLDNLTGNNNTAVGYQALQTNNAGGSANVAIGYQANRNNTAGSCNVSIGLQALLTNNTGSNNTALGHQALYSNTTGSCNTAVGYQAAYNNITGSVTALGYQAAFTGQTASGITAVGLSVLYSNTGNGNVGVGGTWPGVVGAALNNNTTGEQNTAVGIGGLVNNTIGSFNTTFGALSLQANTTGSCNTAIGYQALNGNTVGANNLGVGYRAGCSITTGNNNTVIGNLPGAAGCVCTLLIGAGTCERIKVDNTGLYINGSPFSGGSSSPATPTSIGGVYAYTTSSSNIQVGYCSGNITSTGSDNIIIGCLAGINLTTGSYNIAIGSCSLNATTIGSYNTAVGYQAATSNSAGARGVFVGFNAGRNIGVVDDTIAIGYSALCANNGNNNIGIGTETLFVNSTGANNTAIGRSALQANTIGCRNTALGYNALYNNTLGSNNIAIGNQSGCSVTTGSFNTIIGGNNGTTIATSSCNVVISDGAGNIKLIGDPSGNIGIGTNTPSSTLTVVGTVKSASATQSSLYLSNAAQTIGFLVGRSYYSNNAHDFFIYDTVAATTRLFLDCSGNFGIGTLSPGQKLTVNGDVSILGGKKLFLWNSTNTHTPAITSPSADVLAFLNNAGTQAMTLDASGNLGIGTTSNGASSRLYMEAGGNSRMVHLCGTSADSSAGIGYTNDARAYSLGIRGDVSDAFILRDITAGAERLIVDSSGNLGLGVTPSAWSGYKAFQFAVGSGFVASSDSAYRFFAGTNAFYNGTNWVYKASTLASLYEQGDSVHRWWTAPSGTAGNAITFTQAMTLDASGNLLIGTTSLLGASRTHISSSSSNVPASLVLRSRTAGTGGAEVGGAFVGAQNSDSVNSVAGFGNNVYFNTNSSTALSQMTAGRAGWGLIATNVSGTSTSDTFAVNYIDTAGTSTERTRINSSGVLILGSGEGTATVSGNTFRAPNAAGTNIAGANLTITSGNGTGTGGSGYIAFQTAAAGSSGTTANTMTERARITSGGELLVGSTSSVYATSGRGVVEINGTSNSITAHLINGAAGGYIYHNGTNYEMINTKNGDLVLGACGTERARLTSLGYFLIGNTSSVYGQAGRGTLEINGSSNSIMANTVNNSVAGYVYHNGTDYEFWNTKNGRIGFGTCNTERARFNSTGELLIGSSSQIVTGHVPQLGLQMSKGTSVASYSSTGASARAPDGTTLVIGNTDLANAYSQLVFNVANTGVNSYNYIGAVCSGAYLSDIVFGRSTGASSYAESMRITNSGILLVGATSATGSNLLQINSDVSINGLTVGKGNCSVTTNTAFGVSALLANTTASYNTAVGYQAGYTNTTGSQITAVGYRALYNNSTGVDNTAIGYAALNSNTTASNNIAVGSAALYTNSIGANNVAIGVGALQLNTTASNNTAVGYQALYSNTTGSPNVAMGRWALLSNTTGSDNAAYGDSALASNTTGSSNTAVGRLALYSNTTASNNTAVGYQAGYTNATGTALTAIGFQSAYCSIVANGVTAIGFQALRVNTASNNTAVGQSVLVANTTGTGNTGVGSGVYGATNSVLQANTIGSNNSGFGATALGSNTTGSNNTALGHGALYSNTTASNNTAVGYQAGFSNTYATNNVLIGYQAGYSNTIQNNMTVVGQNAAYATTVGYTTAIGAGALQQNTTGAQNLAVGDRAATSTTFGNYNTIVGNQAFQTNTTGGNNSVLGYQALFSNTTGSNNTAVGYQALYANTTASGNTAVGFLAAAANTFGANITAVGDRALTSNTTGNDNTAVGNFVLAANTFGYSNVGIGGAGTFTNSALRLNTTGYSNTAIGAAALQTNTFGHQNTAVGKSALQSNTSGNTNSAFGVEALLSNTTGSNNTAVGYQALYGNSTGVRNIAIGNLSGCSITTGAYNTIIGSNNGTTIATSSCNVIISDGAGNIKLVGDPNGNIGIGTNTPSAQLDVYTQQGGSEISVTHGVSGSYPKASGISFGATSTSLSVCNNAGTMSFTGGAGIYANNTASSNNPTDLVFWTTAGGSPTVRMTLDTAGSLLVGYTSTNDSVAGSGQFSGPLIVGGALANHQTSKAVVQYNSNEMALRAYGATANAGFISLRTGGAGADAERARISASGNLLIGTTTDATLVTVYNSGQVSDYTSATFVSNAVGGVGNESRTWISMQKGTVGSNYGGAVGGYLKQGTGGGLVFGTHNNTATPVEQARIDNSGNFGIGTTSPVAKLDVYKTATVSTTDPVSLNVPSIQARATTASGKAMLQLSALSAASQVSPGYIEVGSVADYRSYMNLVYSADGSGAGYFAVSQFLPTSSTTSERLRVDVNGSLLIGKTTGQSKALELYQASDAALRIQNSTTGTGGNDGFLLEANGSNVLHVNYESGYQAWYTGGTEKARITSGGDLGIGITAPLVKTQIHTNGLDIVGGNAIKSSTMAGLMVTNCNNDNSSVGIWFGTNQAHWTGISGQRSNYASTWGTDLRFYTHEDATNDLTYTRERMRIDSSGNLGIGTTCPCIKLTVTGTGGCVRGSDGYILHVAGTDSSVDPYRYMIGFSHGNVMAGTNVRAGIGMMVTTGGNGNLVFETGASGSGNQIERMRIDCAGRVLIGTCTASGNNLLQVNSNVSIQGMTIGTGGGCISCNTAFGVSALNANTTGSENTAIGWNAMLVNTIGNDNTAVGFRALDANTSGSVNDAFGVDSLSSNTTGSNNVAIGAGSLASNTTGTFNTGIGRQALNQNTFASYNTAVGYNASFCTTTGACNVAIGALSLYCNRTGGFNVAVGYNALYNSNATGYNIAVGNNAGCAITTGAYNTIIGSNNGTTIATSSCNVIISDGAGNIRIVANPSGSVGLGTSSPSERLSVAGNALIGTESSTRIRIVGAGGVNAISEFYQAESNPRWTIGRDLYASGQSGIGFGDATNTLAAGGSAIGIPATRTLAFATSNGTALTERMRINASGDVGIGTSSPCVKLHVVGASILSNNTAIDPDSYANTVVAGAISDGSGWGVTSAIGGNAGTGNSWAIGHNGSYLYHAVGNGSGVDSLGSYLVTGGASRHVWLVPSSGGNVGVGVADPTAPWGKFVVSKCVDGAAVLGVCNASTGTAAYSALSLGNSATCNGGGIALFGGGFTASAQYRQNGTYVYSNQAGGITLHAEGASGQLYFATNGTERMRVDCNGLVGINTTTMCGRLAIEQNAGCNFLHLRNGSEGTFGLTVYNNGTGNGCTQYAFKMGLTYSGSFNNSISFFRGGSGTGGFLTFTTDNDSERMRITTGGDVGIGSTAPGEKLEVNGNILAYGTACGTAGSGLNIFMGPSTNSRDLGFRRAGAGALAIDRYAGSWAESMRITCNGCVGINTTSYTSRLAVDGAASVGPGKKLSLVGLDINSSGTPTNIKITTTIPSASASADFTVNIKGFVYGNTAVADIHISWHWYTGTFYNASATSSGSWAPTIQLSAEGGFVAIVLSSPGYWPKLYVESMYSSSYSDQYASGWSWSDAAASGSPIVTVGYKTDLGNCILGTSSGLGIGITPTYKLDIFTTNDNGLRIRNGLGSANNGLALGLGSGSPWLDITEGVEFRIKGNTYANLGGWNSGSNTKLIITAANDVGIGTTTPCTRFDVMTSRSSTITSASPTAMYVTGTTSDTDCSFIAQFRHGNQSQGVGIRYNSINATGHNANQDLRVGARGTGCLFLTSGSCDTNLGNIQFTINGSGCIGITTTTPCTKLAISCTTASNHCSPNDACRILNFYGGGVGTTEIHNPSHGITVGTCSANTSQPDYVGLHLHNNCVTACNFSPMLMFGGMSTSGQYMVGAAGIAAQLCTNCDTNFRTGDMVFYTMPCTAAGLQQRMRLTGNGGCLGIGTASPTGKLEVQGADLNIIAREDGTSSAWRARIISRNNTADKASFLGTYGSNTGVFAHNYALNAWSTLYVNTTNGTSDGANTFIAGTGCVGIGTATPSYKLHVCGDIYANGGWARVSGNSGLYFESWGGGWFMEDTTWIRTYSAKSVWTNTGLLGTNGGVTSGYGGTAPAAGGGIFCNNVGIGCCNPASRLHVEGAATASTGLVLACNTYASGNTYYPTARFVQARGNHSYGVVAEFRLDCSTDTDRPSILFTGAQAQHSWQLGMGQASTNDFHIGYRACNNPACFTTWPTSYVTVLTGGNVGIGTTSPALTSGYVGLNVVNNGYTQLRLQSSASSAGLEFKPSSGNVWEFQATNSNTIILYDRSQGQYRWTVASSGNMSIGYNNDNDNGYKLAVNGSFAATTKSFLIDHPSKEGYKLAYGSLESPYHGIRLTGESVLTGEITKVELPDYIMNLVKEEGVNIQLTNIKHGKVLWVEDVVISENYFTVAFDRDENDSKEYKFYWSFTAVRKDIEDLVVEYKDE